MRHLLDEPYLVNLVDLSEIMLLRDAKKATSLGGVPGLVAVFRFV